MMVFTTMDFIHLNLVMMRIAPLMPVLVTGLLSHGLVCLGGDVYT